MAIFQTFVGQPRKTLKLLIIPHQSGNQLKNGPMNLISLPLKWLLYHVSDQSVAIFKGTLV